ncbi:hypothetical protein [Taibaiella koreensis]|uniref:hypothetical protein n=1 Tax=Taibaiella koreensis TaxID=1268548 RepID=UPI0013C2F75C|nr:hypothetical protein [Taibaiella koreensis]
MKRFLIVALLALLSYGAQAALFINNNTTCTFQGFVVAYDINTPGCIMHTNPMTIAPGTSYAYNNVSSMNVVPGWGGGYTATTTGGAWGWRSFLFNFQGSMVGGHVGDLTCTTTNTITVPNVCLGSGTVTVSWGPLASNVVVDIN